MKHPFLTKLLLGTALISSAYNPTLYGMYEEEISNTEEIKSNVVKKKANPFGIKGPLKPWQPINHTGDFDTAPKNLADTIKSYITQGCPSSDRCENF